MARRVIAVLIVLSLTNLAWADDGLTGAASSTAPTAETDSSRESEAPADETVWQLAELIADIDAAELVEDAVAAYNAANLVDRGNLEVNLAYMKKMLKLGQLQYAVYGARWVVSVDPDNILALSVLAYRDASIGDIESAMPMIFHALSRSPDDASLLHDAGQMVAWFDAQEGRTDWPEDIRRPIIASRGAWLSKTSFSEAYEQALALMRRPNTDITGARAVLEEIAQRVAALEEQIVMIEERVISRNTELGSLFEESTAVAFEAALFWSVQELQAKVAAANSRILELQSKASLTPAERQELIGLRSEVALYERAINATYDERERAALIERAGELQDLIRAAQRERDELVLRARSLMRDRGVVVAEYNLALSELAVRTDDRSEMIRRIGAELDWRLPAIDGAVIDVTRAQQDYLSRITSRRATGNAMGAAEELQRAKGYIEAGEIDMAVKCLQRLLVTHEGSRAAEEARELLDRLQPEAEAAPQAASFPSGE